METLRYFCPLSAVSYWSFYYYLIHLQFFYKKGRKFNNNFNHFFFFISDPFIPQEPFYDQQPYQMVPTIKQECPWSQYDCNQELCDSWSSHSSSGGYRSVQSSPTDMYSNDSKPMIQAAALAGYSGNIRSPLGTLLGGDGTYSILFPVNHFFIFGFMWIVFRMSEWVSYCWLTRIVWTNNLLH